MNPKQLTKDLKIAALGGAGLPLAAVAREAGVSKGHAQYTLETKVATNKNGLGDVYEQFREEMRPILQDIVRLALGKMLVKIQSSRVELKDLVSVYNILSGHAGLTSDDGSSTVTRTQTARVNLSNPENIKALREALSVERAEQSKALTSGEKGQ